MQTNVHLTESHKKFIISQFEAKNDSNNAHSAIWKRRSYAPMLMYREELHDIRKLIHEEFPEYTIAFDVIFESDGRKVEWHCDHESLGPFEVDDYNRALRENHFLSLHFNLTDHGGSLVCFRLLTLSYVCAAVIRWFGIFSWQHSFIAFIVNMLAPWFSYKAQTVFNNMALHSVTAGAPRISYVIRLVHSSHVRVSPQSILLAVSRSSNCAIFKSLSVETKMEVKDVDWKSLCCEKK